MSVAGLGLLQLCCQAAGATHTLAWSYSSSPSVLSMKLWNLLSSKRVMLCVCHYHLIYYTTAFCLEFFQEIFRRLFYSKLWQSWQACLYGPMLSFLGPVAQPVCINASFLAVSLVMFIPFAVTTAWILATAYKNISTSSAISNTIGLFITKCSQTFN